MAPLRKEVIENNLWAFWVELGEVPDELRRYLMEERGIVDSTEIRLGIEQAFISLAVTPEVVIGNASPFDISPDELSTTTNNYLNRALELGQQMAGALRTTFNIGPESVWVEALTLYELVVA